MLNNDAPPPEDDITKTILWNRIQDVHDTIELINGKLQNRLNLLQDSVNNTVQAKLDDNDVFIQTYDEKLDSKLTAFIKQVQKIIYSATDGLQKENQKNIAVLEEKIRLMQASIPGIVSAQTKSYLDPTNDKVLQLSKEMDVFKKSLLDTVGKFNTEAISKISALNGKLDDTIKKFKNLAISVT